MLLARLDEFGRGTWIALIVLSFWLWWPLGLAALGALSFVRNRRAVGPGRWYNAPPGTQWGPAGGNGGSGNGWGSQGWGGWGNWGGGCNARRNRAAPSGNRAFDEYRAETLRRLEEEQSEFLAYLERLRQAKDKSEFDAFMAERRNRQTPAAPPEAV